MIYNNNTWFNVTISFCPWCSIPVAKLFQRPSLTDHFLVCKWLYVFEKGEVLNVLQTKENTDRILLHCVQTVHLKDVYMSCKLNYQTYTRIYLSLFCTGQPIQLFFPSVFGMCGCSNFVYDWLNFLFQYWRGGLKLEDQHQHWQAQKRHLCGFVKKRKQAHSRIGCWRLQLM